MGKKVSVIIPMYNAARYITHCVDGLLAQTYRDLEIIVVDDCSTDDSYRLCKETYGAEDRVTVLQQDENGGPAKARNTGMKAAKGDYIAFVDCDDAILPDAFEKLCAVAEETDADVVHTIGCLIPVVEQMPDDLFSVDEADLFVNIQDNEPPKERHIVAEDTQTRVDEWLAHKYQGNVWGKLFRRAFLEENHITFADLKLSEDQIFCFACLLLSKTYVQVPYCLNIYRIAGESLSRGRKNAAYMTKLLRALFEASGHIQAWMDQVPFFVAHSEYVERIQSYTQGVMEDMYIRPSYTRTDREELRTDAALHSLWGEFFGDNAPWVEKMFYDLHDSQPEVPDLLGDMNTYEFWKRVKEQADTALG